MQLSHLSNWPVLQIITSSRHSPLQKRERTGVSFFIDWIENLNILTEMLLNEKLPSHVWEFSVENCPNGSLAKVGKIPYKPFQICGLSTQSMQTLYFRWYFKSYHFAIFLLKILLFLLKTQIKSIFHLNVLVF